MKKSKIWYGLILLAGIVWISASCNKNDDEIELDFDITVPEGWTYYKLNSNNMVYYAVSPLEGQNDSIQENLLITKELATGYTLNSYFSAVMSNLAADTSVHVVYVTDTTINGIEAKKLIHKQLLLALGETRLDTLIYEGQSLKYFFVRNNYGYIASFNTLITNFSNYRPVFETIMASFNFKN
jgi:hypothetical protein